MKSLKISFLLFLFYFISFSNNLNSSFFANLNESFKEPIACVGFVSLDSECVQTGIDTLVEFSWFLLIDISCDPITFLKLEIDQETYHCNYQNHFSQYFIDYIDNPNSYTLSHLVIGVKCFRWRIRTNNSNWSPWQEFTFNDC